MLLYWMSRSMMYVCAQRVFAYCIPVPRCALRHICAMAFLCDICDTEWSWLAGHGHHVEVTAQCVPVVTGDRPLVMGSWTPDLHVLHQILNSHDHCMSFATGNVSLK